MENLSVRRGSRSIFSCSTSQVVGVPMPLALEWYLFRSTQPHPRKRSLLRNQRAPVFPTSRLQSARTKNHQSRSENPGSGLAHHAFRRRSGSIVHCRISIAAMTAQGLGCAKTPALAPHVEISLINCISESQNILHTRGSMPCWRIVFSTFRGCMSFYTGRVIRVIPAIPACPVRPKSGHSANDRVCPRVASFPPPTLGERRHRGLARRLVAVRRGAVLMIAKGQRPHQRPPS